MQPSSNRRRRKINKQYFSHLMQDREMSQRQLARKMNIDQSSLVRAFSGERAFKTAETVQLARLLSVSWEDVLKNLDIEVPQSAAKGGTVAVSGSVVAGVVHVGVVRGARRVKAPPGETGIGLQALRVDDPGAFEGAYVYYAPRSEVRTDAVGRLCVCVIAGGDTHLATPRPDGGGTYTLRNMAGQVIAERVMLDTASPVVWIKTL